MNDIRCHVLYYPLIVDTFDFNSLLTLYKRCLPPPPFSAPPPPDLFQCSPPPPEASLFAPSPSLRVCLKWFAPFCWPQSFTVWLLPYMSLKTIYGGGGGRGQLYLLNRNCDLYYVAN